MSLRTLIRQLISEEIGRNFHTDMYDSSQPWSVDNIDVSLFYDPVEDGHWATVVDNEGKTHKRLFKTEDEAKHWARQQWEVARTHKFSKEK